MLATHTQSRQREERPMPNSNSASRASKRPVLTTMDTMLEIRNKVIWLAILVLVNPGLHQLVEHPPKKRRHNLVPSQLLVVRPRPLSRLCSRATILSLEHQASTLTMRIKNLVRFVLSIFNSAIFLLTPTKLALRKCQAPGTLFQLPLKKTI